VQKRKTKKEKLKCSKVSVNSPGNPSVESVLKKKRKATVGRICSKVEKAVTLQDCCTLQAAVLQPFNGLFSRTTWVSQYQKSKTNLDFTGARNSEWQWHQLGYMQV